MEQPAALVDILTAIVGHSELALHRTSLAEVQGDLERIAALFPQLKWHITLHQPTCALCHRPIETPERP